MTCHKYAKYNIKRGVRFHLSLIEQHSLFLLGIKIHILK